MNNKFILSLLLIVSVYSSYCQQVTYKDLIGSTYSLKDPSMESHRVRYIFKDSLHVDLSLDGKAMPLTYMLDSINGATIITTNRVNNVLHEQPTVYIMVKKADGSNLKMQYSNQKPRQWNSNETANNTILMIPVDSSTIYFKVFGWTIQLPSGFTIMDTAKINAGEDARKKMIEQSTGQRVNTSESKRLIAVKRNETNTFVVNYTTSAKINKENWETTDSATKGILIETLEKQLHVKGTKTNSIVLLDGIRFKKSGIDYDFNSMIYHVSMVTTFYKGRYLMIVYTYLNEDLAIENMLNTSKFDK